MGVYFDGFFFLAMGHLAGLSSKTLRNLPSSSKNHILYIFILLHIYIVLLDCLKLYNFFFYTYMNVNEYYILTLAWNVNKFHYESYTYTECKSQTITRTTLVHTYMQHKKLIENC